MAVDYITTLTYYLQKISSSHLASGLNVYFKKFTKNWSGMDSFRERRQGKLIAYIHKIMIKGH